MQAAVPRASQSSAGSGVVVPAGPAECVSRDGPAASAADSAEGGLSAPELGQGSEDAPGLLA
jgi:hypothetical protein